MSRFFFHAEDGVRFDDAEGSEFPGVQAAQAEAVRRLAEMLNTPPGGLADHPYWKLTVTDERGLVLFVLEVNATLAPAIR